MADDSLVWLSLSLLFAGLALLLYGVSLTAGQATNAPMLGGGALVLVAIGVLTRVADGLPEPPEAGH